MESMAMQGSYRSNKIHPKKFGLWIALGSITMMFVALSSAYIVRQASGNWLEFSIPDIFYWNTAVIIVSSVTLHGAYLAFKQGGESIFKGLLFGSLLLGIAFIVMQYVGWLELMEVGVPLKTNPSGDFVYVISGIHAFHVVGGVVAILVALIVAYLQPFRRTQARQLRLELTLTYWHFVDLLWIYLIVFLTLAR